MTESSKIGHFRGAALIRAIESRAAELDMTATDVASVLGYEATYFRTIMRGGRWVGNLGHEKLHQLAIFLDVPPVTVYVLADILKTTDFSRLSELKERLDKVYAHMKAHKTLGAFIPSRDIWNRTPDEMKILALVLYQRLEERDFLTGLIPGQGDSPALEESPKRVPPPPPGTAE
jgi:hypothetical protein